MHDIGSHILRYMSIISEKIGLERLAFAPLGPDGLDHLRVVLSDLLKETGRSLLQDAAERSF